MKPLKAVGMTGRIIFFVIILSGLLFFLSQDKILGNSSGAFAKRIFGNFIQSLDPMRFYEAGSMLIRLT
jgi:hypothetical protein